MPRTSERMKIIQDLEFLTLFKGFHEMDIESEENTSSDEDMIDLSTPAEHHDFLYLPAIPKCMNLQRP